MSVYKLRFRRNNEEVAIYFSHISDVESKVLELLEETPPSQLEFSVSYMYIEELNDSIYGGNDNGNNNE